MWPDTDKLTPTVLVSKFLRTFSAHMRVYTYSQQHKSEKLLPYWLYRVFQKSSHPPKKTFWNIFTSVKCFCMKFWKFVGSLYPHIFTNFRRFILIFHQMALIFQRVPIVYALSSFERAYSPRKWKCSFSEMTSFFLHRPSQCAIIVKNNCLTQLRINH